MGASVGTANVNVVRLRHTTPYVARPVRFIRLAQCGATTLKVYGISVRNAEPPPEVLSRALSVARLQLDTPVSNTPIAGIDWSLAPTHGAGSLLIHTGTDAVYLLLNVWVGEAMLRQHVWVAPLQNPVEFESFAATAITCCVWEMAVLIHERSAWLRHMLQRVGGPDVDGYLSDVLNADV
jgi:hypothetical protein